MKWSDVTKDSRYQEANVDAKDSIKESWYDSNVKSDPRYKPEQDSIIRKDLFGDDPKGTSLRSARLGTEIVDREIDYHGKPTKLSRAVQQEESLQAIMDSPWLKANVPLVAVGKGVLYAYEQTFGRLFGAYRATLAGKSPVEGLIKPSDQPRAVDSVIKSDFSKRMGVDPATNPEAATLVNGLAGWALDLAGIHLVFNVPFKLAKSLHTTYTGAQGRAVDTFKNALQSELQLGGVPKEAAKQQADILFWEQWVKTGMLKKTPNAIRQTTSLLNANPGKFGSFIKDGIARARTSASAHGYTPEVLQKIPKLSGKTTFEALAEGKVLTPKAPVSSKFELARPPKGTMVSKTGRFIEPKLPKDLTPAERLLQIKTSHMAFKARKASDTLKEATSKQEPVKVEPPKGKTADDMHSTPHIPLKSGTISEPSKPFVPEDRAPKNMFQVTLQTPAGATIRYLSEENLILIKEAIRTAPMTKKLPKTKEGVPITKVHDEQFLNITEMHFGANPGPALREAKKLYEYMEKMADPVRTSPPEVARAIRQRGISQNVLIHNIAQVKSAMQRLVPDPKQQETITAFIEANGEALVGDQMTDNMRMVAELILDGQKRIGMIAKKHGVVKVVLANYMKHMVKDPLLTPEEVDAKIKWALSTGKISKFVESKMPRLRGEDGEMIFPTVASLEAAGYKVVTKNAIDLYDFTMRSEGLAVINAEMAAKLKSIPYVDPRQPKEPLKQLMSIKRTPPRGYKLLRRGVFTQQWASPEAYNAISAVAEPAIGGRAWSRIASTSKRIKFLFPFLHAWNLWRNSVETRGIPGSFKMIADGARQLKDPERTSQILKMGVNLFRINKMSGGITDEFARSLGKWDLPAKTSEFLFTGLGDSVAAGMTGVLEKQLAKAGIAGHEANEILSEIVNTLSGNLGPETMSRAVRDMGRVMLLARNWTLSNIREGKGALLGSLPKYWSKEQKDFGQKWYQSALLRGFTHLFTAANVVNYMVSKHSYGKGRPTWENTGRWDFKIAPLLWVDKRTGKEYYATGWYGSLGDIIHWFTRPVQTLANKLNIPVKEGAQQLFNIDVFKKERIVRDSDNLVEGIARRLEHAAENFLTPAGVQRQIGKYPAPTGTKVLRLFGIMLASSMQDQDLLKKMYNFKEKKKYKVQDIDKELYGKLAEGDQAGFMKKASEERRFQTIEGAYGLQRKFENPLSSYYRGLSFPDKRAFMDTLSPEDQKRLGEAIRRKRQ